MDIEVEILECPDCKGDLARRGGGTIECVQCHRQFVFLEGVYDMRPRYLERMKCCEDSIFEDYSQIELDRPWRRFIGHPWALRFDYEIVDLFDGKRFLELGGGSCYATAMYKSIFPDRIAYASDVSPNALRKTAIPTSRCFPTKPDFFVALDAENLPFKDETVDAIFAQAIIHHLPHPAKMLDEVHRVLRSDGCFIAVDAAIPRHFRFVFAGTARNRERTWGIQEDLIPYARWLRLIGESKLPISSLKVYTNPRYQTKHLFKLMGYIVHRMPQSISKWFFPVGIMIVHRKT